MVCKIAFYIALLGALLFGQTIQAQKSPEQLLDEINRLPAAGTRIVIIVMSAPVGPTHLFLSQP